MSDGRVERRLAAILAADVAGYSRLMGADEEGTLAALKAIRRELADPKIAEHHGRIVKTTGDGLLVEFASVVDAARCAVEVQAAMRERNADVPADKRIEFRIGINLGDIIIDEGDIFGDGVNIAARLEALAEPGGICVNRVVRDQVRDRLDIAFEDLGEQQVKNIARPVRAFRITLTLPTPAARAPSLSRIAGEGEPRRVSGAVGEGNPPLALPDKPSIAVLPFQNMSGDPEQDYFADGMVEEIITALSRIRWLFVIARNSSFTYKGQAVDVKQVGRDLGVRYVLEGSVRKGGNRVRITGQLIDAETGVHLWADRFDGSLEDVFDLQDKVASSVAGVIEPALLAAETNRLTRRPACDPTTYDIYLRAQKVVLTSSTQIGEALRLLEEAIARDPNYGPALALAAICCQRLRVDGRSDDPDQHRIKGIDYARRALRIDGDDPSVLANAAQALAALGENIDAMVSLSERAISLNPSFARGWYTAGMLRNWAGEPQIALEYFDRAQRLAPRGGIGMLLALRGLALFLLKRFDEAIHDASLAIQEEPEYPVAYRVLAASYALSGRLGEAHAVMKRLIATAPGSVQASAIAGSWRNREHLEMYMTGLQLAMSEADEK